MSFDQLGLNTELLRAISEQGYDSATPIQQQAIPAILEGHDVLAAAQTGTGKTAGFTLPMLQLLASKAGRHQKQTPVRALILTPTRELAAQVHESVHKYGQHLPLKQAAIFGGVNINPQIKQLRRGVDILIATPGRLLDLVNQKHLDLGQVEMLVLDEADRMLDMGFIRDIRKIIALLPKQRQNLLFSATFSKEVKQISQQLLHQPVEITVAKQNTTATTISHFIYPVERERKRELLSYLIGSGNWQQVLIFARTKHGADRLSKQLQRDGIRSAALHGNKSQQARNKALDFFKTGSVTALVATDIAARGLDIEQLPHVVNFDLPAVAEDYVHRIGRTGRAGLKGTAISLVCQDDIKQLLAIERLLKTKIPEVHESGFEAKISRTIAPKPGSKPARKKPPYHKNKKNQPAQKKPRSGPKHKNTSGQRPATKSDKPKYRKKS